jgi:ankyrin repeat protein
VRLLLEYGADVSVRDKSGSTPSELASMYEHQEIVELMSPYGAESVKK